MDKAKALCILLGKKYYSLSDLRYNAKAGYLLTKDELNDFMLLKEDLTEDGEEGFIDLPLKSFNSRHIFYVDGVYLMDIMTDYYRTLNDDYEENKKFFLERHISDIISSRIYSEIEGTLDIENVPTTHKKIKEVLEAEKLTDRNDIIIKNMSSAMKYIVNEKPDFNKENLYKLYNILSNNCLDAEDSLNGGYYRDDRVSIGRYDGAPPEKIDGLMNSLFEFVNDKQNIEKYGDLIPHICHYYLVYVHPYFDYNGRTARMVSFWLTYINNFVAAPLFISEAINENKKAYYQALTDTRDANNDLTYFLGYIYETATKFSLVYKNLEGILKYLNKSGNFPSSTEKTYIKKILVHNSDGFFNAKAFIDYINNNITKQAALKMLNRFTDYGVLSCTVNKKGENIFKVNDELITYKFN
ncbi:MAG: Fic family protein [Clostridia bacterium]|nr:Fic family protein [Clostridia bacterium]